MGKGNSLKYTEVVGEGLHCLFSPASQVKFIDLTNREKNKGRLHVRALPSKGVFCKPKICSAAPLALSGYTVKGRRGDEVLMPFRSFLRKKGNEILDKQLILYLPVMLCANHEGTSRDRIQRSRSAMSRTLSVYRHIFISLYSFNCVAQASQETL
jgi:hypothetical protein